MGHHLDAAADGQIHVAGEDLLRGEVDRLLARAAHPVELDGGDGDRESGLECGQAGDVGALVADRRDAAHDDVLDQGGLNALHGASTSCRTWAARSTGATGYQGPALGLANPDGRSNCSDEVHFGHWTTSWQRGCGVRDGQSPPPGIPTHPRIRPPVGGVNRLPVADAPDDFGDSDGC